MAKKKAPERVKYPLTYNPIIEYYNKIESGKEVVSNKVRVVYKKLVRDIHDQDSEWEYNAEKALHPIEFTETFCKHSKGKWAGQKIELELWQKAFIAATFGFIHKIDGTRKYRELFLVVARKNGKSTLSSALCLYLMIADGEGGAEVYAVATKEQQAKIVWSEAKRMVKKSPVLNKRVKGLVKELVGDFNDSSFKPVGSDSDTLDGLNVHCASLDEIHAWKDKNLYDVIVDGCSAREQPLIIMITTAGTVREAVYDMKYEEAEMIIKGYEELDAGNEVTYKDERFLPIIYELDNRNEWTKPEAWKKANPALGTVKKIDSLEGKVNKAKANHKLVSNLLTKDFNVRETGADAWLTFEQIYNDATFDVKELRPNYGIGGVDLSRTTDLTAAKVIFRVPNDDTVYVLQMYWLPEDLLEARSKEDNIPYDKWYEQGLLRVSAGREIHPKDVTQWFLEVRDELGIYLPWIGYDAWSAQYWVEEMSDHFGKEAMIKVHQGKKTLSNPMYQLEAKLEAKKVNYNNNVIDRWCLTNTQVEMDKNLNIQPFKKDNMRKRIDGTAALLNAFVVLDEKENEYNTLI